ncbi:alpha N-terminal protein methyltransferase 1 isoform X2 [Amborella trichopoda]|uniref:Alpha N-terminal protein methyltransferase 1 n=2 Tax=Amborella trichopoda TaxID=13333 RepID=U5CX77_AMBTC|nr:alpha N-terminal protein methyltransferase 1 isoform X2 [Amborella trichopoda]ERN14764.1 hypothetical protein AMTR_s00032p00029730 [Amborella trichopoda]|eukprot:XP_020528528.1 alpha N-terminal protein methyltransferase 1 isoform X2 [Amborella trichopoda]
MEVGGSDGDGREYKSFQEMWREEIGEGEEAKKKEWYQKGVQYWEGIEASIDGVLGGYGHVNDRDVKGSESFLRELLSELRHGKTNLVALDCGSGVGRVTKNLLQKYFNEVDLVEPVSHFLEAARESLAPNEQNGSDKHKSFNFYCVSLQEFTPEVGRYDVIWIQWCIGQLADDDFIAFLERAKSGLKPGGFFVLKENIATNGFVLDKEDKSITRSDSYFKELFIKSRLHLYKTREQKGFPQELFAVRMYALITDEPTRTHRKRPRNRPAMIMS